MISCSQLAKVLIVSPEFKCSNEILTITAMMSGEWKPYLEAYSAYNAKPFPFSAGNVWFRPLSRRTEADAAHARFMIPDGDHLTLLNVYNEYMESASCIVSPLLNFAF
jgi:pre-mRNA-splicing factor ATP-dependent RNA helicase DHX15/PRP43